MFSSTEVRLVMALAAGYLCGMCGWSVAWLILLYVSLSHAEARNEKIRKGAYKQKLQEKLVWQEKSFSEEEAARWLNFMLLKYWDFYHLGLDEWLKDLLQGLLDDIPTPDAVKSISIPFLTLGPKPLTILSVKGYQTPKEGEVQIDLDVTWCPQAKAIVLVKLGGKRLGVNLPTSLCIEKIAGVLQLNCQMVHKKPYAGFLSLSFLGKPELDIVLRPLQGVDLMELPGLQGWLEGLLEGIIDQFMVSPNKWTMPFVNWFGDEEEEEGGNKEPPVAILQVTLFSAKDLPLAAEFGKGKDTFCIVNLHGDTASLSSRKVQKPSNPVWNQRFFMPLCSPANDLGRREYHLGIQVMRTHPASSDITVGRCDLVVVLPDHTGNEEGEEFDSSMLWRSAFESEAGDRWVELEGTAATVHVKVEYRLLPTDPMEKMELVQDLPRVETLVPAWCKKWVSPLSQGNVAPPAPDGSVREAIEKGLRKNQAFSKLAPSELDILTHVMTVLPYKKDDVVMRAGEHATFFGVILDGALRIEVVEVSSEEESTEPLIKFVGTVLGEMALFNGGKRVANVIGHSAGRLAALTYSELESMRQYNNQLAEKLSDVLAQLVLDKEEHQSNAFGAAKGVSKSITDRATSMKKLRERQAAQQWHRKLVRTQIETAYANAMQRTTRVDSATSRRQTRLLELQEMHGNELKEMKPKGQSMRPAELKRSHTVTTADMFDTRLARRRGPVLAHEDSNYDSEELSLHSMSAREESSPGETPAIVRARAGSAPVLAMDMATRANTGPLVPPSSITASPSTGAWGISKLVGLTRRRSSGPGGPGHEVPIPHRNMPNRSPCGSDAGHSRSPSKESEQTNTKSPSTPTESPQPHPPLVHSKSSGSIPMHRA